MNFLAYKLRANAGSEQKISCFWNHGGPQIFMKMSLFDGPNEKIRIPKPFLPKCTRSRKNGGQRIWWLLLLIFGPKTEMMIVGSFLTQFFWNLVSKLDSMISLRFQRKFFVGSPVPPGAARHFLPLDIPALISAPAPGLGPNTMVWNLILEKLERCWKLRKQTPCWKYIPFFQKITSNFPQFPINSEMRYFCHFQYSLSGYQGQCY